MNPLTLKCREDILICSMLTAGVMYSCGPNLAVGTIGVSACSLLFVKNKIQQYLVKSQIFMNKKNNIARETDLTLKLKQLEASQKSNLTNCYKMFVNMIPVIGPYNAFFLSDMSILDS